MNEKIRSWQFLILPLSIYTLIIIIPFLQSIFLGMTDWNGLSEAFNFIGLENYRRVFTDPFFGKALLHNIIWVLLFLLVPTSLGLFLAILMDKDLFGSVLFKSIIYLPMIFSYVIAGMIWSFMYEPRLGIINLFIKATGNPEWCFAWLAEPKTALYAIVLAAAWQHTGLCMVLFLAGLRSVRADLIEAAALDGAGTWQLYWNIILPQLKNSTIVVIALTVINSLKSFDIVYIMTKGGPFRSSEVLTTLMYRESFWNYRMGYGSAIANVLFIITLIVVVFYLRATMKEDG